MHKIRNFPNITFNILFKGHISSRDKPYRAKLDTQSCVTLKYDLFIGPYCESRPITRAMKIQFDPTHPPGSSTSEGSIRKVGPLVLWWDPGLRRRKPSKPPSERDCRRKGALRIYTLYVYGFFANLKFNWRKIEPWCRTAQSGQVRWRTRDRSLFCNVYSFE